MALIKKMIEKEYLVCDVCGTEIREVEDEDTDAYYTNFCHKCHKGLCPKCFVPIGFAVTERQSLGLSVIMPFNQWYCPDCAYELLKHLEADWDIKSPVKVRRFIFNKKYGRLMADDGS